MSWELDRFWSEERMPLGLPWVDTLAGERGSLGRPPNGAQVSHGRGRMRVEPDPTPAPWRSAPTLYYTDPAHLDRLSGKAG
jgi:hypothetical protein